MLVRHWCWLTASQVLEGLHLLHHLPLQPEGRDPSGPMLSELLMSNWWDSGALFLTTLGLSHHSCPASVELCLHFVFVVESDHFSPVSGQNRFCRFFMQVKGNKATSIFKPLLNKHNVL